MSLENTELKIGNTSFKGVYIAILLSLATTLGGGVWTASSLYGRLTAVEAVEIPDIKPLQETIGLMQQQLTDNDVSQLKSKLSELGVNLEVVLKRQGELLEIQKQATASMHIVQYQLRSFSIELKLATSYEVASLLKMTLIRSTSTSTLFCLWKL